MKFAALLLFIATPLFAQEPAPKPSARPSVTLKKLAPSTAEKNEGGGGAADMLSQTKIPEAVTDKPGPAIKLFSTCTDSSGKVFQQDDPGYQNCLEAKTHTLPDTGKANTGVGIGTH